MLGAAFLDHLAISVNVRKWPSSRRFGLGLNYDLLAIAPTPCVDAAVGTMTKDL